MTWEPEWTARRMKETLLKSDEAVQRALVVLYKQQTPEERSENRTVERNNSGYNMMDAQFGSKLAKKVLSEKNLSPVEIRLARTMVIKYVKQLTELQNAGVRAFDKVDSNR